MILSLNKACFIGKTNFIYFVNKCSMKILNVAEKNDAAKNIAGLLSGGNLKRREGKSRFNKIYEFNYLFRGQQCKMVTTSVSGHLLNYQFIGHYRKWNSCSPEDLFSAPVIKNCPEDFQQIRQTLELEVKTCDMLIIWTDCDREGENIGFEIIEVCRKVKPNIQIYRAKFSEITKQSVKRAIENLVQPNELLSEAVNVRSELDLRIGAAFTRFQTLRLQKVFPDLLSEKLVSYGSCQFPTLGFVVERYKAIQDFIPEKFWKIKVSHKINDVNVEFNWKRIRLFDQLFCQVLYEKCLENKIATVENVQTKPKSKWRPVPLDTVELEKSASRKLKINAKETMRIAEHLYGQGYISYPRTETNIFPKEIDLNNLVQLQADDNRWRNFANKILQDGANPRQGTKSDQAHPPIHPTKYAHNLQGNEARVYEYIVRHFLACVSKNAEGLETTVNIDINNEKFIAHGLHILALNYLEVFPYEKWSDKEIHEYVQGQTFIPTIIDMVDGETSAPRLLTEADLIALMEKNGIGTDATHAEHIETIKQRLYVGLEDIYFVPGELGIGLVEGYDSMGFEMSKPHLRAELESALKGISEGRLNPQIVLSEQVEKYRNVFKAAVEQANKIDQALTKYFRQEGVPVNNSIDSIVSNQVLQSVLKCHVCNSNMFLRTRENANSYISCSRYPDCRKSIWFSSSVLSVQVSAQHCPRCGPDIRLLDFKFRPGAAAPFYPDNYTGCINGCDEHLLEILEINESFPSSNERTVASVNTVPDTSMNTFSNSYITASTPTRNVQNRSNYSNSSSWNQASTPNRNTQSNWRNTNMPLQSNSWNQNNQGDSDDVHCNCNIPARRFTVMKESANKGRQFYSCSKPQSDNARCKFFLWADGQAEQNFSNRSQSNSSTFSRNNRNTPSTFRARAVQKNITRKCGICRQQGHTRNNCPNDD